MKTLFKFIGVATVCIGLFLIAPSSSGITTGGGTFTKMEHPELPPPKPIEDVSKLFVITLVNVPARTINILSCASGKVKQYKMDNIVGIVINSKAATIQELRPGLKVTGKVSPSDLTTLVTIIADDIPVEPNT